MATTAEPVLCKLESALSTVEICAREECAFWDRDVPLGGRCAIEELDLSGRPELAVWLLRVRRQLETAASPAVEEDARELLYRLLETGDADGG